MKVNELNQKYRFTEPRHSFEAKGNLCKVYVYYYLDGQRQVLKYSDGLNTKYFTVTKDLNKAEIKKRSEERLRLIAGIKDNYLQWIEHREFNPTTKAFLLPSNELSLLSYYQDFIDYKTKEKIKPSTLIQYQTKYNTFRDYLVSINNENITLSNADKYLYISYFQYLKANSISDSYYNDLLNYHRMVYNFIIDIQEQTVKNPLKVIKSITLNESEKHQVIHSENILESFEQLKEYGSTELSLMAQFIFYTLHRPDTLVKLQLKDFNLNNETLHIPASKIKTNKAVTIQLNPKLKSIIVEYLNTNDVNEDSYLFGYDMIDSIRGQKKQYQLFGINQSDRQDYTLKFNHFRNKQIIKAYKNNPSLTRIFGSGQNLYGYKHSSVVYLRDNNWSIEQVMEYTAHKKTEIAEIYARQYKAKLPAFPSLK
ncbi:tyrosine-type recombinase/integrase [Sphingobacterium sp. CZ-2]|uniref:tyrosine-type recombinase/integrase n=1 Tax=Sphingobacterium sp. CZ-2 TaxID=2557994 RepID=UPI001431E4B4|nr:site-specific integrase [Sphingobacterium sp. CZ-2]